MLVEDGGRALSLHDAKAALICYNEALDIDTTHVDSLCGRCLAYLLLQQIELAKLDTDRLSSLAPTSSKVFKILRQFYSSNKNPLPSSGHVCVCHHHHRFNVHFLPRLIKGMEGCFPTALGRQSTFSNILGPLVWS